MHTELKLNIGCFNNPVDGWVNIDITPHALIARSPFIREILFKFRILTPERHKEHLAGKFNNILRHDVRKGLPFPDKSCIFIYSSHFIEHLFYSEVGDYYKECYRVLKDGGIVRTVVPDFYNYVQKYLNFRQEKIGNRNYESYLNDNKILEEWGAFLLSLFKDTYARDKKTFLRYGHKSLWDEVLLAYVLRKAGFNHVKMYNFREGNLTDLEKLETRMRGSIYIEAEK